MQTNEIVFSPDSSTYCFTYQDKIIGKDSHLHPISAEKMQTGSDKTIYPVENGILIKLLSEEGNLVYLKLFNHKGQLIAQMCNATIYSEKLKDFLNINIY